MLHEIKIIGNLGRDPEIRYLADGTPVTNFSVATNRRWTNADGTPGEETVWFRVAAWRRLGEVCNQYLSKGRQVYVEGRLRPDSETGGPRVFQRSDGSYGAAFEVTASTVKFLGGRDGRAAVPDFGSGLAEPEEEIPF